MRKGKEGRESGLFRVRPDVPSVYREEKGVKTGRKGYREGERKGKKGFLGVYNKFLYCVFTIVAKLL